MEVNARISLFSLLTVKMILIACYTPIQGYEKVCLLHYNLSLNTRLINPRGFMAIHKYTTANHLEWYKSKY